MRSTFPFNIGRFRRSNAHGGKIGGLHHHTERPITLPACAQHTREPAQLADPLRTEPLSDEEFAKLLDSLTEDETE